MEHAEGQTVEEVAGRQQTRDGMQSPTSKTLDISELTDTASWQKEKENRRPSGTSRRRAAAEFDQANTRHSVRGEGRCNCTYTDIRMVNQYDSIHL
jgi:hypothetical protein